MYVGTIHVYVRFRMRPPPIWGCFVLGYAHYEQRYFPHVYRDNSDYFNRGGEATH